MKWKTLSSEYLFNDLWFKVRKEKCETPGGKIIDPYYVYDFSPWVGALALTEDGNVVMVKQYRHAYGENWINQRLKSIEIRKELTDEWKKRGLKEGVQFATLTDIITKAWADKTTKEYKILKGLKKENLRDNMTNTELILNMLAEASTKDISAAINPETFEASKKVAKQGGNVAKVARKELEARTGKKVITSLNAKSALQLKSSNPKKKKK